VKGSTGLRLPASGYRQVAGDAGRRRGTDLRCLNHRVVCIDELRFDADGLILPVTITNAGVPDDPIR
jgi:hypothetical protein